MLSQQTRELNELLDKASGVTADGDRVAYALKGSAQFRAGEYTASEIVLNVPKDADFFGSSFNLYLQGRLVDISNSANNDKTYRPTTFTWENAAAFNDFFRSGNADFRFELRDSVHGNYQNSALFSLSAFSGMADLTNTGYMPLVSSWPGSLQFAVPYYLPRGETLTVRITPIDSRPDFTEQFPTTRREYRLTCVVQGCKLVHAFR